MNRQEIHDRAVQRQRDAAQARHARLERERIERLEAENRARGTRPPNILEIAAGLTADAHAREQADQLAAEREVFRRAPSQERKSWHGTLLEIRELPE